jgi:hypothetical protein
MLDGRVKIIKSLGEEPRRLVPKGVDLSGTVLDPLMKPNGGSIRLPCPVLAYIGRDKLFGGDEPKSYDYRLCSAKYQTRRILVPYVENFQVVAGRPVLNMILFRADNVVRVAGRVKEGLADPADLQVSVNRYYDEIEESLTGKFGLLTRDVFGVRCKHSVRCVAVPEPDLHYWEIGVPRQAAFTAKIEDGDWVLVSRSPVLWQGSVLVMKAVLVDGMAGQANPFIMQGLGLDFDGDELAMIKVPTVFHPEVVDELKSSVGDPTLDVFQWADEFLVCNTEPQPNWSQIQLDLMSRLAPTGMSIGLEDVLAPDKSEFFQSVSRGAKEVPADTVNYAHGLGIKEWAKEAERGAVEVCRLKLEVGLLGAATDKACQVLMAFDPVYLCRGLELKERLTDLMMKNAKRGGGTGYDTNMVTALLDRRGPFKAASVETALDYLVHIGFDREYMEPVISALYDMDGASVAVRSHMPMLQACRSKDRPALVQVLEGNWGHGSIAAKIHEYYEEEGEDGPGGLVPYKGIQASGDTRGTRRRSLGVELLGG